jgi:signal transduction histidine kinase
MTVDIALAVLVGAVTAIDVTGSDHPGAEPADAFAYVLVLIGSVALVWRRAAPAAVATIIGVVLATYWIAGYGSYMSTLGLPALYSLVVHGRDRRRTWTVYGLLSIGLLVVAMPTVVAADDEGSEIIHVLNMALYLAGAGAVGALVRNRQRIFVDTQRRAERAEADRLAEAERAVARERLRIAREMHDVVAHGMSVVAVQAAAARELVHTNPDKVEEVLERIETVSRESLTEMRRMLGVLRHTRDPDASLTPQPTLDDVSTAVAQSVESGVATELVVTGNRTELPAGVGLAAFRIVQEALTNVRKHAGPRASATVVIDYQDGQVVVEVSDDGRGAVSSIGRSGGGNGLIGMRERVDAYGGRFAAGPRVGGGYAVRAVLPTSAPDHRPAVAAVDAEQGEMGP